MARKPVVKSSHVKQRRSNTHPPDDVFFTKEQVKVGTVLRHMGRRNPGLRWRVVGIRSVRSSPTGQLREVRVQQVEKLSDVVDLLCENGKSAALYFSYLSYSAIWVIR